MEECLRTYNVRQLQIKHIEVLVKNDKAYYQASRISIEACGGEFHEFVAQSHCV